MQPEHPWSEWYSVPALAPHIHLSVATIKRRLAQWSVDGKPIVLADGSLLTIQAEKIARPQGDEWRVRVRGALPPPPSAPTERPDSKPPAPVSAPSDDQAALTTITSLVERNALLSDRVASLEREAGRATLLAELLDAERARAADLAETTQAQSRQIAAQAEAIADLAARVAAAAVERDAERARRWWDKLWRR